MTIKLVLTAHPVINGETKELNRTLTDSFKKREKAFDNDQKKDKGAMQALENMLDDQVVICSRCYSLII